jgi:hypothetical protein
MVGRIILAIVAACVVVFTTLVVIEAPWASHPAPQPSPVPIIVQAPPTHSDHRAAEDDAMRRWLSGPPPPLTGYKQW